MHITINSKVIEILDISRDFYVHVLIDYESLYDNIDNISKQIGIILFNNQEPFYTEEGYTKAKYNLYKKYMVAGGYVVLEYRIALYYNTNMLYYICG